MGYEQNDSLDLEESSIPGEIESLYAELRARARFLTQDREGAEDLVQQVCERALRASAHLRPGTNLVAWMKRVMRNLFIDEYRSRRFWVPLQVDAEARPSEEKTPGPIDLLRTADVEAALLSMRASDRAILQAALFDHASYENLSKQFGLTTKTVGTRLFRARAKLRQRLSEVYEARMAEASTPADRVIPITACHARSSAPRADSPRNQGRP